MKTINSLLLVVILGIIAVGVQQASAQNSVDITSESGIMPPSSGVDGSTLNYQADLFTGRFTYSVPIVVSPGRQGAEPKLTLGYNSAAGNGWCGVGWTLDVGYIQRDVRRGVPILWTSGYVTNTYYSNDVLIVDYWPGTVPVTQYDDSKGFVGDFAGVSSPLVLVSATNANPLVYRQQVETAFMTYNLYNDNHWEVVDKSGNTYYFGQGPTNQMYNTKWIGTNASSTAISNTFRWALDKVVDVNGNLTTLTYTNDGGVLYLENISYNGNTNGLPTTDSVNFILSSRTDTNISFIAGYRATIRQILSEIDVKASGANVCKYVLNYETSQSTLRSLLNSVTRYGSDYSTALPPITFSYQVKPFTFGPDTNWTGLFSQYQTGANWNSVRDVDSSSDTETMLIDINGDGLPDRVERNLASPTNPWVVVRNTGTNFYEPGGYYYEWGPLDSQGNKTVGVNSPVSINGDGATIVDFLDINGDGYPDRVEEKFSSPYTNYYVQLSTGAPGDLAHPEGITNFLLGAIWGGVTNFEINNSDWNAVKYSHLTDFIDMNGDGLPDRVVRKNIASFDRFWVQLNTTNNCFMRPASWGYLDQHKTNDASWNTTSDTDGNGNVFVTLIDINGDGLPDRVTKQYASPYTNFIVQFNNGAGFEPPEYWGPVDNQGDSSSSDWGAPIGSNGSEVWSTLVDINGDGLPDRVMRTRTSPYTNHWLVQINTGSGFAPSANWTGLSSQGQSSSSWNDLSARSSGDTYVDLLDMNGDGLPDRVMRSYSSPYDHFVVQFNQGPFPDLMSGVSNGLGGSAQISYIPSTSLDNYNIEVDPPGDPWLDEEAKSLLPMNVWVVSQIVTSDGMGDNYTNSYAFNGGYYNAVEREFRGFSRVTVTDPLGTTTTTYFHQSGGRDNSALGEYLDQGSESKKGIPFRVELVGNDGTTNKITMNKVEEVELHTNGWYFPFISQTIDMDFEGYGAARSTAKQMSYDTNTGNMITETNLGEVTGVYGQNFTTDVGPEVYTWIGYADLGNILNKPSDVRITSDSGGNNRLRETQMSYDSRGNLTNTMVWLSTSGQFVTTASATYDQYGNQISSTDGAGITSATTYDSTYEQYPVTQVAGGIFTNSFSYDVRSGKTVSGVDTKGLVTSNAFDIFFRNIGTYISTNAYGAATLWKTKTSYSLGGISASGISSNYVFKQVNDATNANGFQTFGYMDGLGRAIQSRAEAENGLFRVSDTLFDQRGDPEYQTLPYFSSGTNFTLLTSNYLGTLTEYDSIGRAFRVTPAVRTVFNSSGELVSGPTPTGGDTGSPVGPVTTAFIDLNCLPINPWATIVTDSDGKTNESYRDAYGRVVQLTEITSNGNYNTYYTYDLVGNLTNVTDAAGNSTEMVYDSFGRKTSMIDPDMGTWSYVYDNAGRMTQQTDARGDVIKFFYADPMGRLTHKEIWNPNNYMASAVTNIWDVSDDTNYTVFPGQLYKVIDAQGYQRTGYDVRGRVVRSGRYLNVNSTEYTTQTAFNDADRMVQLVYPGNAATNAYLYDTAGHLTQVRSLSGTGTQEFFYTATSFNDVDQLLSYTNGNGALTTNMYFANSKRLQRVKVTAGALLHQDLSYTYDNVANLESIYDGIFTGSESASLTNIVYDDMHRLVSLNSTARGTKIYGYNSIGNVLTNQDFGTGIYQYGSQPHAATNANGTAYAYDACGNMITRGSQTLTYDEQNQLTKVVGGSATVDFGYAEDGGRLWKYNESSGSYTIEIGGIYEINSGKTLCHVFAGGKRICTFEPQGGGLWSRVIGERRWFAASMGLDRILSWPLRDGRAPLTVMIFTFGGILVICVAARRKTTIPSPITRRSSLSLWHQLLTFASIFIFLFVTIPDAEAQTYNPVFYYYHTDNLGSSNVLTDRSGYRVQVYQYSAFGQTTYTDNTSAFPVANRYTGQIIDDETGLYYYGSRYYDPQLGRFIQPDTIVPSPVAPQTLNRYTYCGNNPLKYVDPTGHLFVIDDIIIGVVVGALLGGIAAAATHQNIGLGILTGAISGLFGAVGAIYGGVVDATLTGAASGAVNSEITGGDVGMGALAGGIGGAVGFGIGRFAQTLARDIGLRAASLGSALIQGATSGAASGTVGAAIEGGNVGEGALIGGASGLASSGAEWEFRHYEAEQFLKNNVRGTITDAVRQAILDAGQSPIAQRMMDLYRTSGSILDLDLENNSPAVQARGGPHVLTGTDRMFFNGNFQGLHGNLVAGEPWGPSLDDAGVFTHELGHTLTTFNDLDPLNVANAENPFRAWAGIPFRNDYGLLALGGASQPVPSRGFWANTFHPWY